MDPRFTASDGTIDHQLKAKIAVVDYFNSRKQNAEHYNIDTNTIDPIEITVDDVYVVWYCFVLGGWKALISTTVPDGMYYECTYNKEKFEMYLDAYKKFDNVAIPD